MEYPRRPFSTHFLIVWSIEPNVGGGGSTKNKLLKAIVLMSIVYINVFLLCLKLAHEKIKGSYKQMCLKINFSLNGVFLLKIF